ncbi:unnamed protein product [Haemonchus placei]|uniref:Lipoprotein n=1 Tax=Haemonchus placei TaxID=6290 RepID=A0A0N4W353_HAEPC|nr:unnamed protein product [Haemonchus placei]
MPGLSVPKIDPMKQSIVMRWLKEGLCDVARLTIDLPFFQLDDQNIDRYMFYQPFYWPTYRYAARRALYVDPIPNSLGFEYPDYWTRYKWYTDWLNPTYWRRHRDPNYDRPLWNSWRPWQMDRSNIKRAIDMYRNGHIDFKTLDEKWITPSAYGRYGKDWADVYLPAGSFLPALITL